MFDHMASPTYSEDGNGADNGRVVRGGQGIVGRADDALGGTAGALLDVDALGRHIDDVFVSWWEEVDRRFRDGDVG